MQQFPALIFNPEGSFDEISKWMSIYVIYDGYTEMGGERMEDALKRKIEEDRGR